MNDELNITTFDNKKLKVKFFKTKVEGDLVILTTAIAVPARSYEKFAQYLATNGFNVALFDFRGVETNRDMVKDASIADWVNDIDSVISYFKDQYQNIHFIGHSIGGQIFGLLENEKYLKNVCFVCASTGVWWKNKHIPTLIQSAFVMLFYIPVSNKFFGFTNARLIKMGVNIPKTASSEWAKWCRSPKYIYDFKHEYPHFNHEEISRQIFNLTVSDDPIANSNSNNELKHIYKKVNFIDHCISAVRPIGHTGFFNSRSSEHWDILCKYLSKS